MGDQRPRNERINGVHGFGLANRNEGVKLYSVQLANEEEAAADEQDGDGDMNSRQVALSSGNMSANVMTRALLKWRSRCMSGSAQDYPMPMSGFHLSPMDYAIPEEEMSHSDSSLNESEEEVDYLAMLPRRRQSLPNTSTYRISPQQNAYVPSQKPEPKRTEQKLLGPVMNSKPSRRHSNGLVKGSAVAPSGGAVGQETMIKDMIVAPKINPSTSVQSPPLVNSQTDVIAILQSVTSNANKLSDLNQSDHSEFFKVNYRCGKGKSSEGAGEAIVPDSEKYRKTPRPKSVSQKSVTDLDLSERLSKREGESVYSTNLLKPCQPLSHPQYLPIPPLPAISDMAVDNKATLSKLLRSRANNTRHQADKPT